MNVDWSSTGMSAASGVIGFLAKDVWDRWRKSSDSKRARRERLERLADLLETSGSLYRSQRMQAQRLFDSVERSQPEVIKPDLSFDQIFSLAFPKLSPDDAQLHAIIRGVTQTATRRTNSEILDWLKQDDWFKRSSGKSKALDDLGIALRQLEQHLNEWEAKYTSVFENDPKVAMNYLADEQEHGTGFPVGIELVIQKALTEL